jgi:hypothetical protein
MNNIGCAGIVTLTIAERRKSAPILFPGRRDEVSGRDSSVERHAS